MDVHHPHAQVPPWAWLMYQNMYNQQQQQTQVPDIIVPARVNKAMEFLAMMTHKQQARPVAAACDVSVEIQIVPGQQLCDEEIDAVATACNLLSNYFSGRLCPDVWEAVKVDGARKQVEHGNIAGRLMYCIACAPGPARPDCPLCHGSGKIMVSAVGPAIPPNDTDQDHDS